MAIKNFLFWLVGASLLLTGCQGAKIRTERTIAPPTGAPSAVPTAPTVVPPSFETFQPSPAPTGPLTAPPSIPKIALIFGPGGAKAYASIGFLQELQKLRIPIQSVGGIEWGAMVGAFYSLKGSINDVEWQLSKIKAEDVVKRSLVSGYQMNDVAVLRPFLSESLGKFNVEQVQLPFACPAYNINKTQTYIMNKGPFGQLMPYCLPYPPLFKAHNLNISGVRDLKPLVEYLRSQGANYVILVNVLGAAGGLKNITGQSDNADNLYWNELAGYYSRSQVGIDQIVNLNIDGFSIYDFDKKRDIIQRGASTSAAWVQQFASRFGF